MIKNIEGTYWCPESELPTLSEAWEVAVDLCGDKICKDKHIQVELKPVICNCGVGYDVFKLRDIMSKVEYCPFCERQGRKTLLRDLALRLTE